MVTELQIHSHLNVKHANETAEIAEALCKVETGYIFGSLDGTSIGLKGVQSVYRLL